MRGHTTLYTSLLPSSVIIEAPKKGQRSAHRDKRDEALTYRYFYHAHLMRRRYDDSLGELEKEFFITPTSIVQRLGEQQALLKELVKKKLTVKELKKMFPFFAW